MTLRCRESRIGVHDVTCVCRNDFEVSRVGVHDVTCVCRNDSEVSRVGVHDVTCVCAEMTLRCHVLVYTT